MSAAGCLQDTPVLCHAHSDMPEHTTETGFAPVHVTIEGTGAVGLCVLTPDEKRWAEQRHSEQTAAGFAGSQQYLPGPSCGGWLKELELCSYQNAKKVWRYVHSFRRSTVLPALDALTDRKYRARSACIAYWRAIKIRKNTHVKFNWERELGS